MASTVRYPAPGCIVEYLEGNAVQIAMVTEEVAGRLRLLLPNRRETRLTSARLLPWPGPQYDAGQSRDAAVHLLEEHKKKREQASETVPVLEVWELAQGEVESAPAQWFAELFVSGPDADQVAAYGRALLACKSHFRFQPPDFQVFSAAMVEKKLEEQKKRDEHEALIAGGAAFFRMLWDVACKKRTLPAPATDGQGLAPEWPEADVAARLEQLLRSRMVDPESQEHEALWKMLAKGLPDVPHLPLQLLTAWGLVPPHYNFWLDRAGYAAGDDWWQGQADEVAALAEAGRSVRDAGSEAAAVPFVSIDSATTRDVDDAFYVRREGEGYVLTLALACPALHWHFGGPLDKAVLHRGTSLYLPEGNCYMLPEVLGTGAFSLLAGQARPAFCVEVRVDGQGHIGACRPFVSTATLAANLTYVDCEAVLEAQAQGAALPDTDAAGYAGQLALGLELARKRQEARIADGAVIMDRPDAVISLEGEGADISVDVRVDHAAPQSQMLVAEMMILASAAVALWAQEQNLPMLFRTQDVVLPKEYAGVWTAPEDMSRIMRALTPSALETEARPHAALGLARYTPLTSPLRRYVDLVNEAQVVHFLREGKPLWDAQALESLLNTLSPVLDAAGQVQRFRPRYWKLLYFRQQGDKIWWDGVITEENEAFVSVSLPDYGLFVRGRRKMFDERACPGMPVQIRLGKVHPLYNEIQIVEAVSTE